MAKKKPSGARGRPPKPIEQKTATRAGKSYTAWYDPELWNRLEQMMASLPYTTEYKEHIEMALDAYLEKLGFAKSPDAEK